MQQTVGVIGLGIMGSAMSANLLKSGFSVVGYDVEPNQTESLVRRGGMAAVSCREVAEKADVMLTALPSIRAIREVIHGKDGLLDALAPGLVVIESSTFSLEIKQEAQEALQSVEIELLDCPLSGTGAQAVTKDLIVFASGDRQSCERCGPVFDGFSRGHHYIGEFGAGSRMKFIANLLVTIHNVAAAEALVLGRKSGLDPELVLKVVSDGAGSSRMLEVRGPMMVAGNYDEATMKMDIYQKDINIINAFANGLQCPTPLMSAASEIYKAGLAQGLAKQDTASVCAVLEHMAGISRA